MVLVKIDIIRRELNRIKKKKIYRQQINMIKKYGYISIDERFKRKRKLIKSSSSVT